MDRSERDPRIARRNIFGPVAMVRVEIPDRDPLRAVREGVERGDRDVAEITKTHGALAHGVVTRRPHQAERSPAGQCRPGHVHSGTRCPRRMFV